MDLVAIQKLVITEEKARRFFLKFRWKNYRKICPRCHGRNVVNVRRKRLLCLGCRYEFGHFTGTYLGSLRIGFRKWLLLIKVFELEASARRGAREVGISYPAALKGFHTILTAILAQDKASHRLKGEVESDDIVYLDLTARMFS